MDILTILRDATIAGTRVSLKGDLLKIGELAYVPERGWCACGARSDARVACAVAVAAWRGSDSECGQ